MKPTLWYGLHSWRPNSTGAKPNLANEAGWFPTATAALTEYETNPYWRNHTCDVYVRSNPYRGKATQITLDDMRAVAAHEQPVSMPQPKPDHLVMLQHQLYDLRTSYYWWDEHSPRLADSYRAIRGWLLDSAMWIRANDETKVTYEIGV